MLSLVLAVSKAICQRVNCMKRRLLDRIHDRAWREVSQCLSCQTVIPVSKPSEIAASSVSSTMPWVDCCADFADGRISSAKYRRNSAVREIVETVGPVDGRFYANLIRRWDAAWLADSRVRHIDNWGDPIRWPGILLDTPSAFSPTTLRYLATALWLRRNDHFSPNSEILEIGVGFGGLAAMNALVSGATSALIDLPQVERAAMRMLAEVGLVDHGCLSEGYNHTKAHYIISNYAFTELNSEIQKHYFEKYIKPSEHGMIISNSGVFASSINGRTDKELIAWFHDEGLPARLETDNELLGPADHLCGVGMILW